MEKFFLNVIQYCMEVIIFLILMFILTKFFKRNKRKPYRLFDLHEYFPQDEVHSLKQIFYLIMMGLCFVDILYTLIFMGSDIVYFALYDILLSLYIASKMDKSSWKNKILVLILIPYASLSYLMFHYNLVGIMGIIHILIFIYFIKKYHDKFREYTTSNSLGFAIILLFLIVFFSFFTTQLFENVNPVDSLAMVSNAFTSNGYAVLGTTILGKVNAIILVWSGYILSGVGTATLTAAILVRYFNNRLREVNDKLETMEELIRQNNGKD